MPLTHRLEPQVSTQRDLSSPDLWLRSLERSRHRREIAELDRRYSGRRKSISAVVSAAMLASPVLPRFAVAQDGSSGSDRSEQPTDGQPAVMMRLGTTGPGVWTLQERLGGLAVDGIFGPKTAAAVREFQARHGLAVTGVVDMETWAALFGSTVSFLDESSPQAQEIMARSRPSQSEPVSTLADARAASARADAVAAAIVPASAGPAVTPPASRRQPRALREGAASSRPASLRTAPSPPAVPSPPAPRPKVPAPPASARPAPASAPSAGDGPCTPGQFVSPVSNYSVSGTFGEDRGDHIHTGLDMVVPYGTPIHAASCGRVTEASAAGGYGNLVCIRHAGGFSTCYAHLSRYGVSAGQYVRVGQVIGYVGCTGSCTGPHLHYEVRYNGVARDPSPYVRARSASASRSTSPSRIRASKATVRSTPVSPSGSRAAAVAAPAAPSEPAPAQPAAASQPTAASEPAPAPESDAKAAAGTDSAPGADGAAGAQGADGTDAAPTYEPAPAETASAPEAPPAETASASEVPPADSPASEPPPESAPEPAAQASVASDPAPQVASLPVQTGRPGAADGATADGTQADTPGPAPEPEMPAVEAPKPPAVGADAAAPGAAGARSAEERLANTATTATASASAPEAAASALGSEGGPAAEAQAPAQPASGPSSPGR